MQGLWCPCRERRPGTLAVVVFHSSIRPFGFPLPRFRRVFTVKFIEFSVACYLRRALAISRPRTYIETHFVTVLVSWRTSHFVAGVSARSGCIPRSDRSLGAYVSFCLIETSCKIPAGRGRGKGEDQHHQLLGRWIYVLEKETVVRSMIETGAFGRLSTSEARRSPPSSIDSEVAGFGLLAG